MLSLLVVGGCRGTGVARVEVLAVLLGGGRLFNSRRSIEMTAKERTAVERRALEFARQLAEEVYGPQGPAMDSSIDDIEEVAMQAVRAAFDGVIARALELQN